MVADTTSIAVYFGIGSNIANELGTPVWHLQQAVSALATLSAPNLVKVSSLYKSLPMGPSDQPDYFNAVVKVVFDETTQHTYPPLSLLNFTQNIEKHGMREKRRHWGERSIDVDILLYGNQIVAEPTLNIPHVGIKERNFVYVPLLEISPHICLNDMQLAKSCDANDMTGMTLVKKEWCTR